MNKKILVSLAIIGVIAAIAVGGTIAYFSDTEVSEGNVIRAGGLKLAIEDITHLPDIGSRFVLFTQNGFRFELDDIKPLDEGTITYELKNLENEAYLCARVKDANENPGEEDEELKERLNFKLNSLSGTFPGDYCQWSQWVSLGTMAGGQELPYSVDYCFGIYENGDCVLDNVDYNPAQFGEMVVDVEFYAEQTRNNPDFRCPECKTNADCSDQNGWYSVDGLYKCCGSIPNITHLCDCQKQEYREYFCDRIYCDYSVTAKRTVKSGCTGCTGMAAMCSPSCLYPDTWCPTGACSSFQPPPIP